jgi:hypothetical protein
MDGSLGGVRSDLPDTAAPLVDLAARWMRDAGLTGPLPGASIEFTFDQAGHVDRYFVKTRGGRRDLDVPVSVDAG